MATPNICGRILLFVSLLVICVSVPLEETGSGNGIQVFKLLTPKKRLTAKFNSPVATLNWVELLVHPSVDNFSLSVESSKPYIASVPQDSVVVKRCEQAKPEPKMVVLSVNGSQVNYLVPAGNVSKDICYNVTFRAVGHNLGYSQLTFKFHQLGEGHNVSSTESMESIAIACFRVLRPIDRVFKNTISILVAMAILGMGNELNFQTIKTHLKKPKAPAIAFVSQFTLMPLLAFAIVHLMGYTGGAALGLFTLGCSPGGGQSNMYSKLLNGDLSLSVTMTTLSTVASLGMLPLWLYTLGRKLPIDEEVGRIQIPFGSIALTLCLLIGPLILGVVIKYKLPRLSRFLKKGLKVFFLIIMLFFFTVGIYSNLYIFQAFDAKLIFSSAMLPYGGYLCGGLLAWICRMDWKLVKTISLETGMQNAAVCMFVVKNAMDSPDSDLAVIPPAAAMFMTALPLYFITPFYLLRQRYIAKKRAKQELSTPDYEEACSVDMKLDDGDQSQTNDSSLAEKGELLKE